MYTLGRWTTRCWKSSWEEKATVHTVYLRIKNILKSNTLYNVYALTHVHVGTCTSQVHNQRQDSQTALTLVLSCGIAAVAVASHWLACWPAIHFRSGRSSAHRPSSRTPVSCRWRASGDWCADSWWSTSGSWQYGNNARVSDQWQKKQTSVWLLLLPTLVPSSQSMSIETCDFHRNTLLNERIWRWVDIGQRQKRQQYNVNTHVRQLSLRNYLFFQPYVDNQTLWDSKHFTNVPTAYFAIA